MTKLTDRDDRSCSDVLVPERLRQAIRSSGLTQSELARRSGFSRDAVSRYCTGRTPIPDSKLVLLAHALDTRPSAIDPGKSTLDGIPAVPVGHPEFLIRPLRTSSGKPGLVRLEITTDLDIALAARIVALLTGQADNNGEEGP